MRKPNKTYYIIVMQSPVLMKDASSHTNKGTLIEHSEQDRSPEITAPSYTLGKLSGRAGLCKSTALSR